MTNEERKIYDLVVRRFLAVLMPPFTYDETTMKAEAGEGILRPGKNCKNQGWKEAYETEIFSGEDEERHRRAAKEQKLPELKKGEKLKIEKAGTTAGKTKPPARFNEATLLSAMENPVKYMESRDKTYIRTLGETGGLGTVATGPTSLTNCSRAS